VADVRYGLGQPPPSRPAGVAILRATNIQRGRITPDDMIFALIEDLPLGRAPLLKAGEVLVVRSGAYTGDSALITSEWEGSAPGYDLRLTPRSIDARFLAYQMLSSRVLDQIEIAKTRAAQPHLNAEDLGDVEVTVSTRDQEVAIADYLDTETARIDAIVRARSATIPLLWERFWAAVDAAVRDVDRREALGRYALSITDGPFGSSLTSAHYSGDEDGARVIRLGNIGRGVFMNADRAFIPWRLFAMLQHHDALPDDLVVAGLGDESKPLGRACVVPGDLGPAIVKADCFRIRLDPRRLRARYAALFLSSPTGGQLMQALARGSTRQRANLGAVASVRVPAPPLEVQEDVVAKCASLRDATAHAASSVQRQIDRLIERRQALIEAAVTGQLDIPGGVA
jgi:type I restriction enzyme S subunit